MDRLTGSYFNLRTVDNWVLAAVGLVILCALLGLSSGIGTRLNGWGFRTGFLILAGSTFGSLFAGLVSLVALYRSLTKEGGMELALSILALCGSAVIVGIPFSWYLTARSVPPIHDITTDTVNPPKFRAVVSRRRDSDNATAYEGDTVARQQKQAYPDIQTFTTEESTGTAFKAVRRTASNMGWTLQEVNREEGRLEATDTTFWFGFKDDIVVRITRKNETTHVDVRSASRVGISDVGTNAQRIRRFFVKLEHRLK